MGLCVSCGEYVPEGRLICTMCETAPANVTTRLRIAVDRRRHRIKRIIALTSAVALAATTVLLCLAMGMPCEPRNPIKKNEEVPFAHSGIPHDAFIGPLPAPDLFELDILPKPEPEPEPEPTIEEIVDGLLPSDAPSHSVDWYGAYRVKTSYEPVTTISGEEVDDDLREFLVKMTYAESGAMSWWGQVYTCSAIINHVERANVTLWDAGHNINRFAVAPWVDGVEPKPLTYQVVDYVLAGGRIEELAFFRSGGRYHDFGYPICRVDEHYFSIMEKKE